ncbi:MAG: tetratricopeptide repeat protein [Candidatus Rifleibacteriota bacterium]
MNFYRYKLFTVLLLILISLPSQTQGAPAFDFGLPLFGYEEIRFDKSSSSDFNFQLLKKYLSEHSESPLHQLHAISRWFSLIRLSDTPRRTELIKISSDYFSTEKQKEVSKFERLQEIFFRGLQLSNDYNENRSENADERFESLLLDSEKLLSNNPDYHIVKAIIFQLLSAKGNSYFSLMKPAEDLKKALSLVPESAHYYFIIGQAFRLLGNEDSTLFLSIASYEKAASLDPKNPKLQNSLLGIYMGLHEDFQARNKSEPFWLEEAVYKKILTLSPGNAYALNNLGYLYAEYGVNSKMAQDLCQRAVDLNPDNPGFRDSLGWAAFKNKDFQTAEIELKKSLSMRDDIYTPHYHIATLYYATGRLQEAEKHYRKSLEFKPQSAEALNNLAYLLAERNKKIDEALGMSKTAVKLEPSNASYLDTLGWLYYRQNKLDQALKNLLKAADLAPEQSEILMHIGIVHLDQGKFATALNYLKEAHKADPNFQATNDALYMAIRLKSYFEALAQYHGLMGERSDKDRLCNILMSIARLYQEEKEYSKAVGLTKLCAEIRKDEVSLAEPLFPFYELEKDKDDKNEIILKAEAQKQAGEAQKAQEPKELEKPGEPSISTSKEQTESASVNFDSEMMPVSIPEDVNFPFVISLGPDFFAKAGRLIPTFSALEDFSFTFFIEKIYNPGKNLIIRIESGHTEGTTTLMLLKNYFRQLNWQVTQDNKTPDLLNIHTGKRKIFAIADRNFVYIFPLKKPGAKQLESMNKVCPMNENILGSLYFDWSQFEKQIPAILRPFLKNPMKPFAKSMSNLTFKSGSLREFSLLSTGKKQNKAFLRNIARQLFAFKLRAHQMGLDATIKVSSENDMLYLAIYLDNFSEFINRKFSPVIKGLLSQSFTKYCSGYCCFLSRMFFHPEIKNVCPEHGKVYFDHIAGLINCELHQGTPAIPIFLEATHACHYYRKRLEKLVKNRLEIGKKINDTDDLLKELIKEYNVPHCPTSGSWEIDKKGKIHCTDHEY